MIRHLKSLLVAPEEKEAKSYKEIKPFHKCSQVKLKIRLCPAVRPSAPKDRRAAKARRGTHNDASYLRH